MLTTQALLGDFYAKVKSFLKYFLWSRTHANTRWINLFRIAFITSILFFPSFTSSYAVLVYFLFKIWSLRRIFIRCICAMDFNPPLIAHRLSILSWLVDILTVLFTRNSRRQVSPSSAGFAYHSPEKTWTASTDIYPLFLVLWILIHF